MNPSDPLVLQGSCLTCPWTNKNLTFEWKLYLISDGAAPLADPKCVSLVTESVNNQHVMTTAITKRHTMKPITTGRNPSRRDTAFTTRRITRGPTRNYKTNRPDEELVNKQGFKVEKGNICNGPITIDSTVTPTTRCKWVPRKPSYGFGFRSEPTTTPGYWICSPTTEPSGKLQFNQRENVFIFFKQPQYRLSQDTYFSHLTNRVPIRSIRVREDPTNSTHILLA